MTNDRSCRLLPSRARSLKFRFILFPLTVGSLTHAMFAQNFSQFTLDTGIKPDKVYGVMSFAQTATAPTVSLRLKDAASQISAGHLDEAEKELQSALRSSPGEYHALDLLGVIRVLQRQETEAEELFTQLVNRKPDFAPGHAHLGLLFLQLGRSENFRHVLAGDPQHSAALTGLGKVEFEQKHYPEALSLLQEAVSKDDSMREAHYYLGLAFARLGRKQESTEQLEIATRLEHEEAEHQNRVADPGAGHTRSTKVNQSEVSFQENRAVNGCNC